MTTREMLESAILRISELEQLADAQAAIIAAKNDEIARLTAALAHAQANDYAGAILADAECGGRGVEGQGA